MNKGLKRAKFAALSTLKQMISTDFRQAVRLSLPVLGAYLFLGVAYGVLAAQMGYSMWVPMAMAMVVYSGSVEFIALTLLSGAFAPASAAVMALTVGARHLFYGISMLDRWRGAGVRKPFLIFMMSDETFAINFSQGGSAARQMWLSVLDYAYWLSGAIIGYQMFLILPEGAMGHLQGLDYVVTAMFASIFMDDFVRNSGTRWSGMMGVAVTALNLILFGSDRFIIPTMLCILGILYWRYTKSPKHMEATGE